MKHAATMLPKELNLRTILLFAGAACIGATGWNGNHSLHFVALLYPFVYLQSRTRCDSMSAAFYYAAATWSVIPASRQFFGPSSGAAQPLLIWFALVFHSALPWVVLYNRRYLPLAAIASLVLLAIPPLGLVTVTHPLVATGAWFPGTRWFGLALPIAVIATSRRMGIATALTILIAASFAVHLRFHRPQPDPHIVPINTHFGGSPDAQLRLDYKARETALQVMVLNHPNSLVLLPESVLPDWNPVQAARWARTLAALKAEHTGLLLGTTIPIPNTEANRNVLLSLGDTEHLSYIQRVPVPLGMWKFGDTRDGFPLMLGYPPTVRVWNQRAGVLVCYEQLLVWTALQTLSRNPDLLLAPSNLYWAEGTFVPKIQHQAAQDWADLWAIPLYEATNR